MRKTLIAVVAALVIAAAGFFGFQYYVQHRTAGEIEAAFEQIRAAGGKASHGAVSFDLLDRTVTIEGIALETAAQPPVKLKIARLNASGVGQPDATQFSADSIEVTDIELDGTLVAQPGMRFTYKVPRITVKDFSGPTALQGPPASSSIIDLYRFGLEQFARVSASSVAVPSMAGTVNFGGAIPSGGDFSYSGLSMQGIKDGKIAAMKTDGIVFTVSTPHAGKVDRMTGNIANIASHEIDTAAAAAILDPQKANDDGYFRVYRQVSAGPYAITAESGLRMRIDGFTIEDLAVRPSRLQLPALLAIISAAGVAAPTAAQTRDIMEKAAGIYEGLRIGNAEMRGLSAETPQGPLKLAAVRLNLENGKIGEFAVEGLDTRSPTGPVKLGRFALKSLDVANLLRMSALYSNPAQRPSPDQALGMLALLEGVELKGLVAPYLNTSQPLNIDTINLSWGQFVGPIPSKAHLTAKLDMPVDATDANLKPLLAAGMDRVAFDFDLGAAWTESSRAFVLEPVALEIGGLLKAQARVSLANVPRGVFSLNPQQAATMAALIEAGTLELSLRDNGAVDLAVAQYARAQKVTAEAARRAIVDSIKAGDTGTSPDALAIVDAVVRFFETPRGTLTLKFTPRAKVPAMQLIELLSTDPLVALAQFQVQVSTAP